jgi:hypothetical protein
LTFVAHVELAGGMELALNLGWALVAAWMFCAWLRIAPHAVRERRAQFVALTVVILILLPAISMTDDLMAAQNPAEIDCCIIRRDHGCVSPHSIVPVMAALPVPAIRGMEFGFLQMSAPSLLSAPHVKPVARGAILNRPPPAA